MFLMFQKKFQNTYLQVTVLFIMFLMFQMFHSLKEALPTRPPFLAIPTPLTNPKIAGVSPVSTEHWNIPCITST